jgi:predicted helicase
MHFYEHFLAAYDKELKVQRGIFYTPQPVVSYIVRSVHELLQTEFGIEEGLASTITWDEMAARKPSLEIPDNTDPKSPFVVVLDPATGTATFLVEVIDIIHRTLTAKWQRQRLTEEQRRAAWNEYVPRHLLPRLYGYELMMAPYAIAHMKLGLKLYETGYRFSSDERVRVYLTNTLEPASDGDAQLTFVGWVPALAHEAQAVNTIKQHQRITVVLGNPPYSNLSANLAPAARALIEKYKFINGEQVTERNALQLERNLNDDYVKFIAWSEDCLEQTGLGILSMISNNVYTWSPSLRGMRAHLMKSFQRLHILDLHGASQRGPAELRFKEDENVFDIEQPVAIGTFCRSGRCPAPLVQYSELIGRKASKYEFLLDHSLSQAAVQTITPRPPTRRFTPSQSEKEEEYDSFFQLSSICPLFAEGVKTGRDWLVVDFGPDQILNRMREIQGSHEDSDKLCERIGLGRKKAWNLDKARAALRGADLSTYLATYSYRPFDKRVVFYHPNWIASRSFPVMRNLVDPDSATRASGHRRNIALLAGRISRDRKSRLYWCSDQLTDKCILSSLDNVSVFPALVFPTPQEGTLDLGVSHPEPNLSREFLRALVERLGLRKPTQDSGEIRRWTFEIFHYFYAILWSPAYRERYDRLLSLDFPRLPLTSSLDLFRTLAALGGDLATLHLMKSLKPNHDLATFVEGVTGRTMGAFSKTTCYQDGRVYLDTSQRSRSSYFEGVPEDVWNFRIGGYRVLHKWLYDRRGVRGQPGRMLTEEDITHYQRIVVALKETMRLMGEIDDVIEAHGGWPIE